MRKTGMGSHQSAKMMDDTWITPKHIIDALGLFDLDPCTPETGMPWDTARKYYTKADDGLKQKWEGRVWLNPPYSREVDQWMRKIRDHNNGIALVFARTETACFFSTVWNHATSILFLDGRLYFHRADGTRAKANSGAPSVLIAYGEECSDILEKSGIKGKFIRLKDSRNEI